MFMLKKHPDLRSIRDFVRLYSIARKTHYEVLNLRKNCTDKEIKDAFIQMSKEYHPDKNKSSSAQEKFVKIVEAYNVLGKPSSRAQYDHMSEVSMGQSSAPSYHNYRTYPSYNVRNDANYGYYYETRNQNRKTTNEQTNSDNYYGFKGIRKLPNMYIIAICFGIAFVGVVVQLIVIRNMYVLQRRKANEKSQYLAEELEKVRTAAKDNGNELQTRLLLDKIVSAANPTVTTASLGQALANQKKDGAETLLTEFGVAQAPEDWYVGEYPKQAQSGNNMKAFNWKLNFETW